MNLGRGKEKEFYLSGQFPYLSNRDTSQGTAGEDM